MRAEERPLVLVVDDDELMRESLRRLLSAHRYQVAVAAHGAEALTALNAGERPALILTDLSMPVMDGWQLLAALRQDTRLAAIPTIALSGQVDTLARGLATRVLPKPPNMTHLLQLLRLLIVQPPTAPGP